MHKSSAYWWGFTDGRNGRADNPFTSLLADTCCKVSYAQGFAVGAHYRSFKNRLKSKLYWLAPLGAVLWLLLDKIGHLFGICLGG